MDPAGRLSDGQITLMLRHLPVGISVADENDTVVFWAGPGFETCSPKLIGRDLYACHPKRAHAAMERLLEDLKSGAKDEVDTVEHHKDGTAERIIYSALRGEDGVYRGVMETVIPLDGPADV